MPDDWKSLYSAQAWARCFKAGTMRCGKPAKVAAEEFCRRLVVKVVPGALNY